MNKEPTRVKIKIEFLDGNKKLCHSGLAVSLCDNELLNILDLQQAFHMVFKHVVYRLTGKTSLEPTTIAVDID